MANNLFIAYDLDKPGQDYAKIEDAIKALGSWARLQGSVWYVHTKYTGDQVEAHLRKFIDTNDRLLVIDALNAWGYNNMANWSFVQQQWNAAA
jgi:hypothetical protein